MKHQRFLTDEDLETLGRASELLHPDVLVKQQIDALIDRALTPDVKLVWRYLTRPVHNTPDAVIDAYMRLISAANQTAEYEAMLAQNEADRPSHVEHARKQLSVWAENLRDALGALEIEGVDMPEGPDARAVDAIVEGVAKSFREKIAELDARTDDAVERMAEDARARMLKDAREDLAVAKPHAAAEALEDDLDFDDIVNEPDPEPVAILAAFQGYTLAFSEEEAEIVSRIARVTGFFPVMREWVEDDRRTKVQVVCRIRPERVDAFEDRTFESAPMARPSEMLLLLLRQAFRAVNQDHKKDL